jgi:hypothetical protein
MHDRIAPTQRSANDASTVVCWEFTRGRERLSCRIDRDQESGSFAVAVVSLRDLHRGSLETFQAAAAALCRHAILATNLRTSGWKLASYTT